METFDDLSFKIVLKYIYTGRMSENSLAIPVLLDIMRIAKQLELTCLSKEIASILSRAVSIENVVTIYEIACLCKEQILIDKCEKIIYTNLESLGQHMSLSNMSKRCLEKIIKTNNNNSVCEFDIFKLTYQWYKIKNVTYIEHDLVNIIDFSKFSSDQLKNVLNGEYSQIIDSNFRLKLFEILLTKLSHYSSRLASGSDDTTIKIWNLETGECIKTLTGHTNWVLSLQPLAKNRLASGSGDKTIIIWNLDTGESCKTLTGHTGYVLALQSLKNNRLASGSSDSQIKIWNLDTNKCVKTLTGHTNGVLTFQLLADNRLASGSSDSTIKIWNVDSGEICKTLTGHTNGVLSLQLLPNNMIVSGSGDKTIKIWNVDTRKCHKTLTGHTNGVLSLQLLANNSLASGSYDQTRSWILENAQKL